MFCLLHLYSCSVSGLDGVGQLSHSDEWHNFVRVVQRLLRFWAMGSLNNTFWLYALILWLLHSSFTSNASNMRCFRHPWTCFVKLVTGMFAWLSDWTQWICLYVYIWICRIGLYMYIHLGVTWVRVGSGILITIFPHCTEGNTRLRCCWYRGYNPPCLINAWRRKTNTNQHYIC